MDELTSLAAFSGLFGDGPTAVSCGIADIVFAVPKTQDHQCVDSGE